MSVLEIVRNNIVIERRDDATRKVTVWDDVGALIPSTPQAPNPRDYTANENIEADERASALARLDDHETRIKRIETKLWPPPPDPTSSTDPSILDWAGLGGVWPDGGLVKDGGKVWRNVAGVPLTTAPTAFPGAASQWTHLFVEVAVTPPAPTGTAWAAGVAYKVDDLVTYGGSTYKCIQAHTSQVGWEPPNVGALWAKQ